MAKKDFGKSNIRQAAIAPDKFMIDLAFDLQEFRSPRELALEGESLTNAFRTAGPLISYPARAVAPVWAELKITNRDMEVFLRDEEREPIFGNHKIAFRELGIKQIEAFEYDSDNDTKALRFARKMADLFKTQGLDFKDRDLGAGAMKKVFWLWFELEIQGRHTIDRTYDEPGPA